MKMFFFFMMRRIATQQWRNLISQGVVAGPQMFDEKQICGARPEISTTMGSSSLSSLLFCPFVYVMTL